MRKPYVIVAALSAALLCGCQKAPEIPETKPVATTSDTTQETLSEKDQKALQSSLVAMYEILEQAYNLTSENYDRDTHPDPETEEVLAKTEEMMEALRNMSEDHPNTEEEVKELVETLQKKQETLQEDAETTEASIESVSEDLWDSFEQAKEKLEKILETDLSGKDTLLVDGAVEYLDKVKDYTKDGVTPEHVQTAIEQMESYIQTLK